MYRYEFDKLLTDFNIDATLSDGEKMNGLIFSRMNVVKLNKINFQLLFKTVDLQDDFCRLCVGSQTEKDVSPYA